MVETRLHHGPARRRHLHAASIAMIVVAASACAAREEPETVRPPAPVPLRAEDVAVPALPPIPFADGPLRLDVAYPPEGGVVTARDSNFIFGSTGSGRASLSINGHTIQVKPNGAFLAFIPVPEDGVYRLEARKKAETASLERRVRVPQPVPPPPVGAEVLAGSVAPVGAYAVMAGENVQISFTGTSGGRAWLVTPWNERYPLLETRAIQSPANNAADFQIGVNPVPQTGGWSRYSGLVPAQVLRSADTTLLVPLVGDVGNVVEPDSLVERCAAASATGQLDQAPGCAALSPDTLRAYRRGRPFGAHIELVVGNDTALAMLPLNLAIINTERVGIVVDRAAQPSPDFRIRGRAGVSGPFHYFWPARTQLSIIGQRNDMYRVRLAPDLTAWVPAEQVQLLPEGTPPPTGIIGGARFTARPDYIDLRIGSTERLPYYVSETERGLQLDVYGATSAVNFFQYGSLDPLIARAGWSQPMDSVFRVNVELTQPVWGYHAFHDTTGAVVLRIRRPPVIDDDNPLRGMLIAVDAGHGGADSSTVGPTRFTEARANLMIAQRLKPMLEAAGARVLMTRPGEAFVELGARPQMATDSNAHVLVSIHNNAFPDGVNPFLNNGTSVYYYHPHSVDLAQQLQAALLNELHLRDIGYGRADLALARPTWLPAALTETAFMMVPEQEAALRDPAVQERIARAHFRAIEAFFRRRAAAQ